jgi:cyclic-di-AMP phosphodiesterase PgpH
MSNGNQRRSRLPRVTSVEPPSTLLEKTFDQVRRGDVLMRLGMCLVAAAAMIAMVRGWEPPFGFRSNYTPIRGVVSRVDFKQIDQIKTQNDRENAKRKVTPIFINDTTAFDKLQAKLKNLLNELAALENIDKIRPETFVQFFPQVMVERPEDMGERLMQLQELRDRVADPAGLDKFYSNVTVALLELKSKGVLDSADAQPEGWSEELINLAVRLPDKKQWHQVVTISEVRIEDAKNRLLNHLKNQSDIGEKLGTLIFSWLNPQIIGTLKFDKDSTQTQQEKEAAAVPDAVIAYKANTSILAPGGTPLRSEQLNLLRNEHTALLATLDWKQWLLEVGAMLGMFIAFFLLSGFYAYYREQSLLTDFTRFSLVLGLAVMTIGAAYLLSGDDLRAEMIPLLVFCMTIAIAFHAEIALLLAAQIGLAICFALGQGLADYVILLSAAATSVLLIGRLRTRWKLILIALATGIVVGATSLGVNVLDHQPVAQPLLLNAGRHALWAFLACLLVTSLLPIIEKVFGVLTDLRLLELGDPSHPLLQELVQRAPGTYNHSISVASLAEAAAEAIGARGLLVRVGAYFHDIGKMNKPGYFVENQGRDGNRHESLNPTMSTLVIIAHIKDGADLARQHHLPQPIIDFIQQHHGTTLVEYFYHRASKESENNPDAAEVDEASFRYPGPKPQSKETGILMLADAAESASRTLSEPTPARIEGLIHDLALKRLLDGQFDECGLTLRELAMVEESLVKSLTAVYHGRIKYPEQRTA